MTDGARRMHVLVTRAEEPAKSTARRLRDAGHAPVILPLVAYRDSGATLPDGAFDGLVFTSAAAVEILARRASGAWSALLALPVFCVGEATARAAQQAGFSKIVTGPGAAPGLAATIRDRLTGLQRPGVPGRTGPARLLWLAPRERAFDLARALSAHAIAVTAVELYRAETLDPGAAALEQALRACAGGAALLYSPRTASHLVALASKYALTARLARLTLIAISENVARAIAGHGIPGVLVSEMPQEDGLLAILDRLGRDGRASPRTDDDEGHH